jgi:hypothetical protein
VSGRRNRKRRRPSTSAPVEPTGTGEGREVETPSPRRAGPFGGSLFGVGDSSLPPVGRSLGRGLFAIASQPVLLAAALALIVVTWFVLVGLGFEGRPAPLAQLLAFPPISTLFDSGIGQSMFGLGPGLLIYLVVAFVIRSVVVAVLTGVVVESVEDGRVSLYGVLRGLRAIPTIFAIQVLSLSAVILGNNLLPILGPGIGLLAMVAALVGVLFFLGFAPAAAVHDRRAATESIRRAGRAARLPGGNQLVFCALYFILALVVTFVSPGANEITANPTLSTWVFVMFVNVLHLAFMAAFAYRWIVVEPDVPEQPLPRRRPARAPAPRARSRR